MLAPLLVVAPVVAVTVDADAAVVVAIAVVNGVAVVVAAAPIARTVGGALKLSDPSE